MASTVGTLEGVVHQVVAEGEHGEEQKRRAEEEGGELEQPEQLLLAAPLALVAILHKIIIHGKSLKT